MEQGNYGNDLVHIASYRDPECEHTIRALFQKASRPERVSVGLFHQTMPDDHFFFHSDRLRAIRIDARESKGTCWARSLGYTLYRGEDYILQIDSHMRFVADWDEKMLEQLAKCPSAKPMLTTYAPSYEPPDQTICAYQTHAVPRHFEPNGYLRQFMAYTGPSTEPKPTALFSGHFAFARSHWISEVPYDPQLYYAGEEPTIAVRLWTHGWDLYAPSQVLLWHQYGRLEARRHWDDHMRWWPINLASLSRMRHLLGMENAPAADLAGLSSYGLGTVRTLSEYEKFSGIDFGRRTIQPLAQAGETVADYKAT